MSVLLDGVKDTHAREALKGVIRRLLHLESRVAVLEQSSTTTTTFIPTGTGLAVYAALPATTGFEVGTVIAVDDGASFTVYRLVRTTAVGAMDWMQLEAKVY